MSDDPTPEIRRNRLPLWSLAALCLGALGAGAVVLPMLRLDPVPRVQQAPDLAAPGPAADPPDLQPDPAADPRAPRFDLVRMAADGRMIVAGRATPGALVAVLVDGVRVAETRSDGTGQFVVFLTLERSATARVLGLVSQDAAGTVVASDDSVILAPDAPGAGRIAKGVGLAMRPEAPAERAAPHEARAATAPAPVPAQPLALTPMGDGAATPPRLAPATPAPPADAVATVTAMPSGETPAAGALVPLAAPLRSDAAGVRLMASAPLAGAAVRLDSVDYGAAGDVVLRGRAAPGGIVRATLSGLPPAEVAPDPDGTWTLRLPRVAPGDYRLDIARASEPGAPGTDRVTVPFRRAAPADVAAALAGARAGARIVTVQPGATLWAIARDRYGDGARFVQVYDANRDAIGDPDLIYPGQVFRLPDAGRAAPGMPVPRAPQDAANGDRPAGRPDTPR